MFLKISAKAERPRLRSLLGETLELACETGINPTYLEVLVYGSPPGKRNFGVFQYVFGRIRSRSKWETLCGRILLQPRQGATDREIVRLFAHELGHLRDFQNNRACCLMSRDEKEWRAQEFAEEILEQWERRLLRRPRTAAVRFELQ